SSGVTSLTPMNSDANDTTANRITAAVVSTCPLSVRANPRRRGGATRAPPRSTACDSVISPPPFPDRLGKAGAKVLDHLVHGREGVRRQVPGEPIHVHNAVVLPRRRLRDERVVQYLLRCVALLPDGRRAVQHQQQFRRRIEHELERDYVAVRRFLVQARFCCWEAEEVVDQPEARARPV